MKLAENFTLDEFEASETATRMQILNHVPKRLMANARETCAMLQRIRDFLSDYVGREIPITITSGYRCLALNREIRAKDDSQHIQALAADWRAPNAGTPTQLCHLLQSRIDELRIGQIINEYPDANGWVHVSASTPPLAINRVLTITYHGTDPGIHSG